MFEINLCNTCVGVVNGYDKFELGVEELDYESVVMNGTFVLSNILSTPFMGDCGSCNSLPTEVVVAELEELAF